MRVTSTIADPTRISQPDHAQVVRNELSSALGDTVSVQTFSGETKAGVDEARNVLQGWLGL